MSEKKTVLVVDDDPDFNNITQSYLKKAGFLIKEAFNGVEAMEIINNEPPDAVVLDVMMPEKNGYQVCSELKGDERFADIPILLLTSVGSNVTSNQVSGQPTRYSHFSGMYTEADDYLEKTASGEEIVQSIKKLIYG